MVPKERKKIKYALERLLLKPGHPFWDLRMHTVGFWFFYQLFFQCKFVKIYRNYKKFIENHGLDPDPEPDWIRTQQVLYLDPLGFEKRLDPVNFDP